MWTYLPKFLVKISLKELCIKQHFTQTLIYFVPTIATSIYTVLDKTLLQFITHDELQNGYYAQAEKVINLSKSIVFTAINSVVGVRISYSSHAVLQHVWLVKDFLQHEMRIAVMVEH